MKVTALVLLAVLLGLSGDVYFKRSVEGVPWLGFLLYTCSGVPVWYSYKVGTWMQIGILFQALAIIVTIGLGVMLFAEPMTPRKLVGFVLAMIAAWLAQ